MSQWTSPGRIVTGLVGLTAVVAALASATGSQRAQSLGLTQHGQIITAQDAGAADAVSAVAVTPGTVGQVLTVSDAGLPHWAAAASSGGGITVTTLYASDFTAVAGSESASISGSGAASTFTIGASSTTRTYGSGGTTAARIIAALPSDWRTLDAEVQITSVTGAVSGGWRYMTLAVQPQGSGTPTVLWGTSWPDTGTVYYGDRLGGANAGSGISIGAAALTADRWQRMTMSRTEPRLSVLAGIGSAGARPSVWIAPSSAPPAITASPGILDTESASYLVLVVQSFGSGAASNAYTGKITVRATP